MDSAGIASSVFHGGLDREKVINLSMWKEGRGDVKTMLATKAMNAGVDYPKIHLVIILDYTDSVCDMVQSFGRAGRDKMPAKCVFISNFNLLRNTRADKRLLEMFTSNLCLRFLLDKYLNDWGFHCEALSDPAAKQCSRCRLQLPATISPAATTNFNSDVPPNSHSQPSENLNYSAIIDMDTTMDGDLVDDDQLAFAASLYDSSYSTILTNITTAVSESRTQTTAGGNILQIMRKLESKCAYCIGNRKACTNHSIKSCPFRHGACEECAVAFDHHGMNCPLNRMRVTSRCWLCWLKKHYGQVQSHKDNVWGKNCPNISWHGMIKMWAATLWYFKDSVTDFQIVIDAFIEEAVRNQVNDLKTFVTNVSEHPDVFVQHIEGLITHN